MITDIARIIQCKSMPKMYCQMSTDIPEGGTQRQQHGPDDDRCGDDRAGQDQHDDEDQNQCSHSGDQQVVGGSLFHVLGGGRGAGDIDVGVLQRGAFDGLEGGVADRVDVGDALGGGGVSKVRDDEAHRFSVR
jgi:hypothetical protein